MQITVTENMRIMFSFDINGILTFTDGEDLSPSYTLLMIEL
ncbi:MAG: hypothetical protein P8I83_02550 [Paracoccaceae bacterium]|nr:hypothetical protein [Paracoccaceae bacterium]